MIMCNFTNTINLGFPDLDFNIADPGPYFLNDEMRVSANLGAGDIDSGSHMDIESFGFALNCHDDEDFHSCTDAGNDVAFLTTPVTNCLNANGDPATLIIPQTNIIPIRSTPSATIMSCPL